LRRRPVGFAVLGRRLWLWQRRLVPLAGGVVLGPLAKDPLRLRLRLGLGDQGVAALVGHDLRHGPIHGPMQGHQGLDVRDGPRLAEFWLEQALHDLGQLPAIHLRQPTLRGRLLERRRAAGTKAVQQGFQRSRRHRARRHIIVRHKLRQPPQMRGHLSLGHRSSKWLRALLPFGQQRALQRWGPDARKGGIPTTHFLAPPSRRGYSYPPRQTARGPTDSQLVKLRGVWPWPPCQPWYVWAL